MNLSLGSIKDGLGSLDPGKLGAQLLELAREALSAYISAFTQANRLVRLQIGDGKAYDEWLLPQSVEGREALSECYKFEVTCLSRYAYLPLAKLLGESVQLDITAANSSERITRCGLITEAYALPSDGGFAKYRLTIEPPLALLRHRRTSRVFQGLTVPNIVKTILAEHAQGNTAIGATLQTEFELTKQYPERSYCLQYRETDLAFIERILFMEGISYRWAFEDGETPVTRFIAFDDPLGLPQADQGTVRFHRADATEADDSLTEWTESCRIGPSRASLTSFDYKPVVTFEVAQANRQGEDEDRVGDGPEAGLEDNDAQGLYYGQYDEGLHRYAALRQDVHERQKGGYRAEGNLRGLIAGQWFQLAEHPAFDKRHEEEREFVACALEFTAHNNLPQGLASRLASLAGGGGSDTRAGEDARPYWVRLSARQRGLPLTPAYAHTRYAKPTARGIQTALVTGEEGEREVFTDEMGRIKIQFHWQRGQEHPNFGAGRDDRSSCWVRVAYPGAGAAWGHQSIPRIGQEVLVDFIEGDIDRPVVTGVFHNGMQSNPQFSGLGHLPGNRTLTGIKTKEFNGRLYNEILFDDTEGQTRARLSSEHGKTQLNQGFLTHPRFNGDAEPRGDGFELRTDRHGALRAAEGLLISTEAAPGATGKQLDRQQAQSMLDAARQAAQRLAEAAGNQNADVHEIGPEERDEEGAKGKKAPIGHIDHMAEATRAWEGGTNTDSEGNTQTPDQSGKQPLLLLSGVAGIGLTTPQAMVLAAQQNLDTVSLRDTQQTTTRRWIHNAGKKISLFVLGIADVLNLKLITAKGHAKLEAQSGDIEITGDKNLRVYASKKKITATAGEELVLVCGGAYVRLKGGNIEFGSPGDISFKSTGRTFDGPTSMEIAFPVMPNSETEWIAIQPHWDIPWKTPWPLMNLDVKVDKKLVGKEITVDHTKEG